MKDVQTAFDQLKTRCPRLGGEVPFDYCRKVNNNLPCSKSVICWEFSFPVDDYMRRILTKEEWEIVFESPPESRMDQILNAAARTEK